MISRADVLGLSDRVQPLKRKIIMSEQKIGFFGKMKPLESAESHFEHLHGGGMRASITHEVMRDMTIDQLVWWFHNIDQRTMFNGEDFNGAEIDNYKLWHPHDHIKVRWKKKRLNAGGHIQPGSIIHINETFAGHVINEGTVVSQFDRGAFHFEMRLPGLKIGHVLHFYEEVDGGVLYRTELEIKCRAPIIGRFFTWLACRFFASEGMVRAWMIHNVEEVGESEKFIPQLYAHAMAQQTAKVAP